MIPKTKTLNLTIVRVTIFGLQPIQSIVSSLSLLNKNVMLYIWHKEINNLVSIVNPYNSLLNTWFILLFKTLLKNIELEIIILKIKKSYSNPNTHILAHLL